MILPSKSYSTMDNSKAIQGPLLNCVLEFNPTYSQIFFVLYFIVMKTKWFTYFLCARYYDKCFICIIFSALSINHLQCVA